MQLCTSEPRTGLHKLACSGADADPLPSPLALTEAVAGAVRQSGAETALFFYSLCFFIRMSHTPPSPTPTSSVPPYPHTPTHPSDTVLEPSQIKKLIAMRKCWMTLHRDITVGAGAFFLNCWIFCFSSCLYFSTPGPRLPLVPRRDLCQSAVGHRDILWHRPPLRLPLCLLEALLAAMAGQGGRRPEPDIGAAARKRRRRKPRRHRRVVALTPAAAEEGGPLLILALPLPGPSGPAPPPFLWPGGAGEGRGRRCDRGTTRNPGALVPGYGLLPQQCWWELADIS